jgi:hypothetical protein
LYEEVFQITAAQRSRHESALFDFTTFADHECRIVKVAVGLSII